MFVLANAGGSEGGRGERLSPPAAFRTEVFYCAESRIQGER